MFMAAWCGAATWMANVNIGSRRGVWGYRVSPRPRPAGAWGHRVSPSPTRGRVWEGAALPRSMFIPSVCGAATWMANVNRGSRRGVWGHRVSLRPRPAGAWGHRVSPLPHPREGLGGRSPPKNKRMFMAALCGAAAWMANVKIGCWGGGVGKPGFPT